MTPPQGSPTDAGVVLVVPAADDAIGGQAKFGRLLYEHITKLRSTTLVCIALRSKLSGWRRPLQRPLFYRNFMAAVGAPERAIVHIFSPCSRFAFYEKALLALYAKARRRRVIINFRNDYQLFYGGLSAAERHFHRYIFESVDMVVCQSRDMANFIRDVFSLPEGRVEAIYNCLEPSELEEARQCSIDDKTAEGLNVLYLGHLCHRKGTDILVAVARTLRDRGIVCTFDVCGLAPEPKHFRQVKAAIEAHQLQDSVLLHGVVVGSDKESFFHRASVFLLPSRKEGFSNAILEAMARGIPVVTTPVGANREIIVDGRDGRICPVDDVDAFADAIQELLSAPQRRRAMGSAAREKVVRLFSADVVLGQFEALYQRLDTEGPPYPHG